MGQEPSFAIFREGQRTQVIAAENDLVHGDSFFCSEFLDEADEIFRFHAGIAAVLIYLIGSCFNEQDGIGFFRSLHAGTQDKVVGGAGGIDTDCFSFLLEPDDVLQWIFSWHNKGSFLLHYRRKNGTY